MNRRNFLTALAPVIALAAPVQAQLEIGTAPLGTSGRLAPGGAPAPVAGKDEAAVKGPTEITAREAHLDNKVHLATFTGEVVVKDPQFDLTCDKLTVYLRKPKGEGAKVSAEPRPIGAPEAKPTPEDSGAKGKGKDESGIDKAIAEGNVVIVQEKTDANGKVQKYYGKAKRAVFDNNKQTCTLYGWPTVAQSLGGNMGKKISAKEESTVITLDQSGAIDVDGLHKTTLADVSTLEPEKK